MHPFPSDHELAFLTGAQLLRIDTGPYSVSFVFNDGKWILSEHAVVLVAPDKRSWRHDVRTSPHSVPDAFHELVGKHVCVVRASRLSLDLSFEDGCMLQVETEIGPYESGQIGHQGENGEVSSLIVF